MVPIYILSFVAVVAAQVPFPGSCPKQNVLQGFSPQLYLGKWYEQERYFAIFQAGGKCVSATYSDSGNGVVGVLNEQINIKTRQPTSIKGTATLSGQQGEAKLSVRFPSAGNFAAPYWVLDTDYTSYSIVWSCKTVVGLVNTQFMWVLTREKNPSDELMAKIRTIITGRKLSTRALQKTTQDCSV